MMRPPYETLIRRGWPAPDLDGPVLLVDGPEAWPDAQIWERLAPGQFKWWVIGVPMAEAEAAVPKSVSSRLVCTPANAWIEQVTSLKPGRASAYYDGLLMVGPPTEEAWEEFEAALSRRPSETESPPEEQTRTTNR